MSADGKPLCHVDDLPPDGAREFRVDGDRPTFVIVLRRGQTVSAWLNACPHAGRPLNWAPDKFLFSPDDQLVCAAHGATFELESGTCVLGPCPGARLTPFPIETRDGEVWPA